MHKLIVVVLHICLRSRSEQLWLTKLTLADVVRVLRSLRVLQHLDQRLARKLRRVKIALVLNARHTRLTDSERVTRFLLPAQKVIGLELNRTCVDIDDLFAQEHLTLAKTGLAHKLKLRVATILQINHALGEEFLGEDALSACTRRADSLKEISHLQI